MSPSLFLPRSEDLSASLQPERVVPPTAGAVLPLQWLTHHTALLPECALDSLQSKGPDFNRTGEWWRGETADIAVTSNPFPLLRASATCPLIPLFYFSAGKASRDTVLHGRGAL